MRHSRDHNEQVCKVSFALWVGNSIRDQLQAPLWEFESPRMDLFRMA